jgi:Uncharacterized vancomycin resistance protein
MSKKIRKVLARRSVKINLRIGGLCLMLLLSVLLLSSCKKNVVIEDPEAEHPTSVPSEVSQVQEPEEERTVFKEGTTLAGQDISGKTVEEALEAGKKYLDDKMEEMEISIKFIDDTISLRGADFVYQQVLDLTLPKILQSGEPGDYEISYVADLTEEGKQKIVEAADACYKEGKNATVAGYEGNVFSFSGETTGYSTDPQKAIEAAEQLVSQKHGGALQAEIEEKKPTLSIEYLQENFKQISIYQTISTNTENGNHNMRLALSKINGTILEPGGIFSYNGILGDSTTEASGFKPAGGLVGGLLVQLVGGGICQGATTVYGAALRAGVEITSRTCHAREATYCPIGLDATVDYGNIDFKFKNTLEAPIYISSWMEGTQLTVIFYSIQPSTWDKIELYSEKTETHAALTTISFKQDSKLAAGEYVRVSDGKTGSSAIATRSFYKDGVLQWTENLPSSYHRPLGIIYSYGPGTNVDAIDTSRASGNTGAAVQAAEETVTPTAAPNTEEPVAEPVTDTKPKATPKPTEKPQPKPTAQPQPDPTQAPAPEPADPEGEGFEPVE